MAKKQKPKGPRGDAELFGRVGAQRARVYNSGHAIYLYDAVHRDALQAEDAGTQLRDAFESKRDVAALAGRVLAYELEQDDSVDLRVLVGEPLQPGELATCAGLAWKPVQRAVLTLPTGALVVESNDSCHIEEHADPREDNATLAVPPGRYVAHLYRVDWDSSDEAAQEVASEAELDEVVVLAPLAADGPVPEDGASPALPYPVTPPRAPWSGKYTVKDGRAEALGRADRDGLDINLDAAALQALGVELGTLLEVKVGTYRATVACLGVRARSQAFADQDWRGFERVTAQPAEGPAPLHVGWLDFDRQKQAPYLRTSAPRETPPPPSKSERWAKASARVLPGRFTFPDLQDLGAWRQDDATVEGVVLLHGPQHAALNLDARALQALGAGLEDVIEVQVNGVTLRARLVASQEELIRRADARAKEQAPKTKPIWDAINKLCSKAIDRAVARGSSDWKAHLDTQRLRAIEEEARQLLVADTPLCGYLAPHWYHEGEVLFLESSAQGNEATVIRGVIFPVGFPAPTLGRPARVSRVAS